MNYELEIDVKNFSLEQLANSPFGERIQKMMTLFENTQNHLIALSEKEGEEKQTSIKIVTVMTFSLLKKFYGGKTISDLTNEDWKEVARDVSQYAILPSDQEYAKFIFVQYARYIQISVDTIQAITSEDKVIAIQCLADELMDKTRLLEEGEIGEVQYIEDCLWISLEAIIKLFALFISKPLGESRGEFVQALATYSFEYGRFILYSREQELVNEFLEAQQQMDKELEDRYTIFIEDLENASKQFRTMIENAFVPDFRESFFNSIKLAQLSGVDGSEVLKTIDEIDAFFE